jgi:hypothetical protein
MITKNAPKRGLYLLFIFLVLFVAFSSLACDDGNGNPTGKQIQDTAIKQNPISDSAWWFNCTMTTIDSVGGQSIAGTCHQRGYKLIGE